MTDWISVEDRYGKFAAFEWRREEFGLWVYDSAKAPHYETDIVHPGNGGYTLFWPVEDGNRQDLQRLCNELNNLWKQRDDEWISVENELPKKRCPVLACNYTLGTPLLFVAQMIEKTLRSSELMWIHSIEGTPAVVTNWQPLPDLPGTPSPIIAKCECGREIEFRVDWNYCPECGRGLG